MTETAQQTATESQKPKTFAAKAFAAQNTSGSMAPYTLQRREPRPQDVQIEILYCGVCHSDLHQVKNEWVDFQATVYPCVPGHEIVGRVAKVGSAVKKFKEGDFAAVGCMVDSDRVCENCRAGEEQYCIPGATFTYNSPDVNWAASLAAVIPRASWWTKRSSSTSRPRHLAGAAPFCVPASPSILRCATGKSARDKRLA